MKHITYRNRILVQTWSNGTHIKFITLVYSEWEGREMNFEIRKKTDSILFLNYCKNDKV